MKDVITNIIARDKAYIKAVAVKRLKTGKYLYKIGIAGTVSSTKNITKD